MHVPDADEAICDALAPKRVARLLKAMLPFRALVETCVKASLGGLMLCLCRFSAER
jgi:hypothetical protein